MHLLFFETKKLYRNGSFLLVIGLALVLSLANQIYMASYQTKEMNSLNDLQSYFHLTSILTSPSDSYIQSFDNLNSQGKNHVFQLIEMKPDPRGEFEQVGEIPITPEFFKRLLEAADMDNITLNQEDKNSIEYGFIASTYIQAKVAENANYSPDGAVNYLLDGNWILYGILPILLLSLIAIRQVTEDYQGGSIVYNRTLPVGRAATLFAKWGAILFIFCVFISYFIL